MWRTNDAMVILPIRVSVPDLRPGFQRRKLLVIGVGHDAHPRARLAAHASHSTVVAVLGIAKVIQDLRDRPRAIGVLNLFAHVAD
jgi:hypothetical protein